MTTKHNATLNISYNTVSDEQINQLCSVYETSKDWKGYVEGIPYWFNTHENSNYVNASFEMHGIVLEGVMQEELWNNWLQEFIAHASKVLEFDVIDLDA